MDSNPKEEILGKSALLIKNNNSEVLKDTVVWLQK